MQISVDYKQSRVVVNGSLLTHAEAWELGCDLREQGDMENGLSMCHAAMCLRYTLDFMYIYEAKKRRKKKEKGRGDYDGTFDFGEASG